MNNKKNWVGMLVMVLVFGMAVVGCDDGSTNNNGGGNGGIFTLTGIPSQHNGKYAWLFGESDNAALMGAQSINMTSEIATLVQISNGTVSLPMWILTESGNVIRYSGNDTSVYVFVGILNKATYHDEEPINYVTFESVTFSNGSATKSWNNGEAH